MTVSDVRVVSVAEGQPVAAMSAAELLRQLREGARYRCSTWTRTSSSPC